MSEYLGFKPTENPFFYFLSYNSEDKERVKSIAMPMFHKGINLWYDYGIDYGESWEDIIANKIKDSQAVVLFFTKGILAKKDSYVQKEYRMAKFLNRKIYVIFMDKILDEDVPIEKVSWWLDIMTKQNINFYESNDVSTKIESLGDLLGIKTHEDRMSKMIASYNTLYFNGRINEANILLNDYMRNVSLNGKVEFLSNLIKGGFDGSSILVSADNMNGTYKTMEQLQLRNHLNEKINCLEEMACITVNNDSFIIGINYLFHRGSKGDATVIQVWRNGELVYTIPQLVESHKLRVFWDSIDNIIYISYLSDCESKEKENLISITTIEDPNGAVIFKDFKFLDLKN